VYNEIFKGTQDDYRKYNLSNYVERESVRRKPIETRYNNTSDHSKRVTQSPAVTSSKVWTKVVSSRQSEHKNYSRDRKYFGSEGGKENWDQDIHTTTPVRSTSKYDDESRNKNLKYSYYKGK
jgi:hypothetical protein